MSTTRRLLVVGAGHFQVPAIAYAKSKGHVVFTVDNRPNNPGHYLADQAFNYCVTDQEALLDLANHLKPDAILGPSSDVCHLSAIALSARLGLPSPQRSSIQHLTNKYLTQSALNAVGAPTLAQWICRTPKIPVQLAKYPSICQSGLVVKPVDAWGSRGISYVDDISLLEQAILKGANESARKTVVIEPYLTKQGPQICGDGLVLNGTIQFVQYGDGHFYEDKTHFAPIGESFPSSHPPARLRQLTHTLDRLFHYIGYTNGLFNVDAIVSDNRLYIVDIAPRAGGNYIPQLIHYCTGVNLTKIWVDWVLGRPPIPVDVCKRRPLSPVYGHMMHQTTAVSQFKMIRFSDHVLENMIHKTYFVRSGDPIPKFSKASDTIGSIICRYPTLNDLKKHTSRFQDFYEIVGV